MAACGFAAMLALGWFFWPKSSDSKTASASPERDMAENRKFAEEFLELLKEDQLSQAFERLTPELLVSIQYSDMEQFREAIDADGILRMEQEETATEETPEGDRVILDYRVEYENHDRSILVCLREVQGKIRLDGIASLDSDGKEAHLGARGYEELLFVSFEEHPVIRILRGIPGWVYAAMGITLLGLAVLNMISMWIVYEKSGEDGWAIFVPFYNMWVFARVGNLPGWLGLAMCSCNSIPVVGFFLWLILQITICINIAKEFGRGVIFGIGLSLFPFIFSHSGVFTGLDGPCKICIWNRSSAVV